MLFWTVLFFLPQISECSFLFSLALTCFFSPIVQSLELMFCETTAILFVYRPGKKYLIPRLVCSLAVI